MLFRSELFLKVDEEAIEARGASTKRQTTFEPQCREDSAEECSGAGADVVPPETEDLVHEECLRRLVSTVPVERREYGDGHEEDDEHADEGRSDGRDSAMKGPEQDDEAAQEEQQGELKENGEHDYDEPDPPFEEPLEAILAEPRIISGCPRYPDLERV